MRIFNAFSFFLSLKRKTIFVVFLVAFLTFKSHPVLAEAQFSCYPGKIEICTDVELIKTLDFLFKLSKNQHKPNEAWDATLSKKINDQIKILELQNTDSRLYRSMVGGKTTSDIQSQWNATLRKRFLAGDKKKSLLHKSLIYYVTAFNSTAEPNNEETFSRGAMEEMFNDQSLYNKLLLDINILRQHIGKVNLLRSSNGISIDINFSPRIASVLWGNILKSYSKNSGVKVPLNDVLDEARRSGSDNELPVIIAIKIITMLEQNDKNAFVDFINNDIEKIINVFLESFFKENKDILPLISPYAESMVDIADKQIQAIHRERWIEEKVNKFHANKERMVFLSRTSGNTPPRVNKDTGDLEIPSAYYETLRRENLLHHVMNHEAQHVYGNVHGVRDKIIEQFAKKPSKIIEAIENYSCKSGNVIHRLLCAPDQALTKAQAAKANKEFHGFYRNISPFFRWVSEISADIGAMESVPDSQINGYLRMLEISLPPGEKEQRIILAKKYIALKKELFSLGIPEEHVYYALLFERHAFDKKLTKKPHEEVITHYQKIREISEISRKVQQEQPELWSIINALFRMDAFYQFERSFSKVHQVLEKHKIKETIMRYHMTSSTYR